MPRTVSWSGISVLAFAGVFLPVISVPLQTYLANKDMFAFSGFRVVLELLPFSLVAFIVLVFVLWFSECWTRKYLHVIVIAVLTCLYLEVSVLSSGLPPLNGDLRGFGNPFRQIVDSSILGSVFIGVCILHKWVRRFYKWIAFGFIIMATALILDACLTGGTTSKSSYPLESGFCRKVDAVRSFRFSSTRNVLVFILDSVPASLAADVTREHPELTTVFPGFTAYDNNIGMHYDTRKGVPGLMTGIYLEPDVRATDYTMSSFGYNSFLYDFTTNNYSVYFSGGALPNGYCNKLIEKDDNSVNQESPSGSLALFSFSHEIPYISLYEVSLLRLVPYYYKYRVISDVTKPGGRVDSVNSGTGRVEDEKWVYSILEEAPVANDGNKSFGLFHTIGVHPGVNVDSEGKTLSKTPTTPVEYKEPLIYRLKQLGHLFQTMKEKGLYDNSFIVVTADHGLDCMKANDRMHGAESAMLWIKPAKCNDPFRKTQIPTSHCKIAELMRRECVEDVSKDDIDKLLFCERRVFRAKRGTAWWSCGRVLYWSDWIYDQSGTLSEIKDRGIFKAN